MNKSTNLKVAVSTDVCICDVNRNEIDDVSVIEKCSSVDDFYDNYGEYARVRLPNCPSNVFLYRDGGVCLIILAACSFDVCIDDYQKLDKNSL